MRTHNVTKMKKKLNTRTETNYFHYIMVGLTFVLFHITGVQRYDCVLMIVKKEGQKKDLNT